MTPATLTAITDSELRQIEYSPPPPLNILIEPRTHHDSTEGSTCTCIDFLGRRAWSGAEYHSCGEGTGGGVCEVLALGVQVLLNPTESYFLGLTGSTCTPWTSSSPGRQRTRGLRGGAWLGRVRQTVTGGGHGWDRSRAPARCLLHLGVLDREQRFSKPCLASYLINAFLTERILPEKEITGSKHLDFMWIKIKR